MKDLKEDERGQLATDLIKQYSISEQQYDELLNVMHVYLCEKRMFQHQFLALVGDILDIVNDSAVIVEKSTEDLLQKFEEEISLDD